MLGSGTTKMVNSPSISENRQTSSQVISAASEVQLTEDRQAASPSVPLAQWPSVDTWYFMVKRMMEEQ